MNSQDKNVSLWGWRAGWRSLGLTAATGFFLTCPLSPEVGLAQGQVRRTSAAAGSGAVEVISADDAQAIEQAVFETRQASGEQIQQVGLWGSKAGQPKSERRSLLRFNPWRRTGKVPAADPFETDADEMKAGASLTRDSLSGDSPSGEDLDSQPEVESGLEQDIPPVIDEYRSADSRRGPNRVPASRRRLLQYQSADESAEGVGVDEGVDAATPGPSRRAAQPAIRKVKPACRQSDASETPPVRQVGVADVDPQSEAYLRSLFEEPAESPAQATTDRSTASPGEAGRQSVENVSATEEFFPDEPFEDESASPNSHRVSTSPRRRSDASASESSAAVTRTDVPRAEVPGANVPRQTAGRSETTHRATSSDSGTSSHAAVDALDPDLFDFPDSTGSASESPPVMESSVEAESKSRRSQAKPEAKPAETAGASAKTELSAGADDDAFTEDQIGDPFAESLDAPATNNQSAVNRSADERAADERAASQRTAGPVLADALPEDADLFELPVDSPGATSPGRELAAESDSDSMTRSAAARETTARQSELRRQHDQQSNPVHPLRTASSKGSTETSPVRVKVDEPVRSAAVESPASGMSSRSVAPVSTLQEEATDPEPVVEEAASRRSTMRTFALPSYEEEATAATHRPNAAPAQEIVKPSTRTGLRRSLRLQPMETSSAAMDRAPESDAPDIRPAPRMRDEMATPRSQTSGREEISNHTETGRRTAATGHRSARATRRAEKVEQDAGQTGPVIRSRQMPTTLPLQALANRPLQIDAPEGWSAATKLNRGRVQPQIVPSPSRPIEPQEAPLELPSLPEAGPEPENIESEETLDAFPIEQEARRGAGRATIQMTKARGSQERTLDSAVYLESSESTSSPGDGAVTESPRVAYLVEPDTRQAWNHWMIAAFAAGVAFCAVLLRRPAA